MKQFVRLVKHKPYSIAVILRILLKNNCLSVITCPSTLTQRNDRAEIAFGSLTGVNS